MLAIQGPPGAGKTFCGARMICELVRQGKKVGITATSHKVIRNLLDAVAKEADRSGTDVRLAHKNGDDADEERRAVAREIAGRQRRRHSRPCSRATPTSSAARRGCGRDRNSSRRSTCCSSTKPDRCRSRTSSPCRRPRTASCCSAIRSSSSSREREVIPTAWTRRRWSTCSAAAGRFPPDRGIFLPVTWRLSPAICEFTSEMFYDGRLTSRAGLERQRLTGVTGLPSAGLAVVAVDHDGNRNYSTEEVDCRRGAGRAVDGRGATWENAKGVSQPIAGSDVLVVAPYNAQVTRLAERLAGTGVRVGTVDKFQGQEAPVVIYSMATSRPEDAPRGMEFLYSLNRLNVATSRARCVAILVASSRLFEPECRSPRQMKLANALCRFRELASRRSS